MKLCKEDKEFFSPPMQHERGVKKIDIKRREREREKEREGERERERERDVVTGMI
jgi:hypothetical protein